MAKEHIAPQAVIDRAEKAGFNTVRYLGMHNDYSVWGLYDVDSDGSVVPTGLPALILHKDGKIETAYGQKAFALLDSLEP